MGEYAFSEDPPWGGNRRLWWRIKHRYGDQWWTAKPKGWWERELRMISNRRPL